MQQTGKSVEELRRTGETVRIAQALGGATGWSSREFGSGIGRRALFAARFFQSRLETLARAGASIRPGATLEQRIARRAMLRFLGLMTMLTVGINALQGRPTDLRPMVDGRRNANFMRIQALGRDVSLFGTWDSLLGVMVATATGKPQDAWRGMAAGPISMGWDLLSGTDFIDRPVRDDPVQFMTWLLRSFSPFAAEELPEAAGQLASGQVPQGAFLIGAEIAGVKSAPLSFTDVANDVTRELGFGDEYRKALGSEKKQVREHEKIVAIQEKRKPTGRFAVLKQIDDDRKVEEEALVQQFLGLDPDHRRRSGKQFREDYRFIQHKAAVRYAAEDPDYRKFVKDSKLPSDSNKRALVQYYNALAKSEMETGAFDFENFEETVDSYDWSKSQQAFVDQETGLRDHPPLIQQYLNDREMIDKTGYFSAKADAVKHFDVEDLYEEYLNITPPSRDIWLERQPELQRAFRAAELKRARIRERGRLEILLALVKWGYVDKLKRSRSKSSPNQPSPYERWVAAVRRGEG